MKRLYWRATGPAAPTIVALALGAALLLGLVENFPQRIQGADFEAKVEAAQRAERAFAAIAAERPARGLPPFEPFDLAHTGLLGPAATDITTSTGSLPAKRTAANPNFAAVLVWYLRELNLKKGDVVAVGYSGSFPGLNIATLAAVETLGLEPLIITSAASSDYGASAPRFSWLEMERLLRQQQLIRHGSLAASVGGIEDQGIGLTQAGLSVLSQAIEKSGAQLIAPKDFEASLDERMKLYDQFAKGRPIRAYVNVGGGTVSVGRARGKSTYKPGINRPLSHAPVDSIIGRFLARGVPAIHLTKAEDLARQFQLPVDPKTRQVPGTGAAFGKTESNRWLAAGALLLLGAALVLAARRARIAVAEQASADGATPAV